MARGDAVSDELAGVLLAQVEKCWQALGSSEPYWSVVTDERFKSSRLADNKTLFFDAGKNDVRLFQEAAARCKVTLPVSGTCLDLGCGVGRITVLLAADFRRVIGIDISSSHLRVAQTTASEAGLTNIQFKWVNSASSYRALPRFDCFYSMIVLQHNPPPIIAWILDIILDKLNPGGIGFFQVPTEIPGYRFDFAKYLEAPPGLGEMEMHVFRESQVSEVVDRAKCELLEVRKLGHIGSEHGVFKTFLVRKKNPWHRRLLDALRQ